MSDDKLIGGGRPESRERAIESFHKWFHTPLPHCETTDTPRLPRPVDCKCATYPANMGPCPTFSGDGMAGKCPYCDHLAVCHAEAMWLAGHEAGERDMAERAAQLEKELADSVMFLRIVLTRKDITHLKPKIADWLKRRGHEGSILRALAGVPTEPSA